MGTLNLGKVVGSDAKINGQTAVTMTGANGISVTTKGQTVTIDGKSIADQIPTISANGTAGVPSITSDYGTIEIGTYIDFHNQAGSGFNGRIYYDNGVFGFLTSDNKNAKLIGDAATLEGLHANEIASNPNLLMNPDFKINQRELADYSSDYTVDRWYLTPGKGTVSVESNGLRLSASAAVSSNTHLFWQNIEFPLPPGKYTLCVNAAEVTGVWSARIRTVNANGDYVDSYYTPAIKAGLNTVTVELPDGEYISAVSVGLNKGTNSGDSVKLTWIKLEQGGFATPFAQPDPATELAKCQRYFIRLSNIYGWIGTGFTNNNYARISVSTPVSMRTVPTMTLNGSIYINTSKYLTENAIVCTTFTSITYLQNAIGISFNLPSGANTVEPCFAQFSDNTSYIDFSAEL